MIWSEYSYLQCLDPHLTFNHTEFLAPLSLTWLSVKLYMNWVVFYCAVSTEHFGWVFLKIFQMLQIFGALAAAALNAETFDASFRAILPLVQCPHIELNFFRQTSTCPLLLGGKYPNLLFCLWLIWTLLKLKVRSRLSEKIEGKSTPGQKQTSALKVSMLEKSKYI